jgi:hypothetical protein
MEQLTKAGELCIEKRRKCNGCLPLPFIEEGGAIGAPALHGRRRSN